MVLKQIVAVVFCLLSLKLSSQTSDLSSHKTLGKVRQFMVQGQTDSVDRYLTTLPESPQAEVLKNIRSNKASYADALSFVSDFNAANKQQLIKLHEMVEKTVREPSAKMPLNLDYVKIRWHQISGLLNEEMLNEASELASGLKKYISKFPKKEDPDVIRAVIYASTYDIVVSDIQRNYTKLKQLTLENLKKATHLKDTVLIIASRFYYSDYLVGVEDIDGYIENCKACLALENKLSKKSFFYEPTTEHLIDASIHKGEYDEAYIEGLLHNIYSDPNSKYFSYSLYAKFLGSIAEKSATQKRIFKQFGVNGLEAFCDTVTSQAKNNLNSNEFYYLYVECAKALYKFGYFAKAFSYKSQCEALIKKIYSQELAQTIADVQTREVEQTKALENAKLQKSNAEKELTVQRQKIILWISSLSIAIFVILLWFLYRAVKARNKTNAQLAYVNSDLNRLNLLNQKIFSVISHDFKAPMITLSMLVSGFKKKSTDAAMNEHIAEVVNQFDNANSILTNLLDWSKTEINIADTTASPFCSIGGIASEITSQLQVMAQNKHISFDCRIPAEAVVKLPADILRIVFRNLVSNAIKFSYENSVVKIVFDANLNQLQVIDTGMGMKREKADQLFKKDVVSSFGTNREPGFGMGLYIVHELLYKYNCSITVDSELEKGTRFIVTFPNAQ